MVSSDNKYKWQDFRKRFRFLQVLESNGCVPHHFLRKKRYQKKKCWLASPVICCFTIAGFAVPPPKIKLPRKSQWSIILISSLFRYYQFCIHPEAFLGLTLILSGLPSGAEVAFVIHCRRGTLGSLGLFQRLVGTSYLQKVAKMSRVQKRYAAPPKNGPNSIGRSRFATLKFTMNGLEL